MGDTPPLEVGGDRMKTVAGPTNEIGSGEPGDQLSNQKPAAPAQRSGIWRTLTRVGEWARGKVRASQAFFKSVRRGRRNGEET